LKKKNQKKSGKKALASMEPGRSAEPFGAPGRSRWPWRRLEKCENTRTDEEKAGVEQLASIDSRHRRRRRRKTSTSSSTTTALASALRAGLGVFLFAAVGLWSWDPLKALLLERDLQQKRREFGGEISSNFSVGGDGDGEKELRASASVALAAKANLNAAVTVALLSAPASLGNTVGIAVQRMLGAALGCLAAAGIAALGHGAAAAAAAAAVSLRGGGGGTPPPPPPPPPTPAPSLSSNYSSSVSAPVQALSAVVLGTLAVYLGQRARVQYGAQLFGVSLFFVLAQSGASPREASELALSRGGGVMAGAALAAALAVAVLPQSAAKGVGTRVEGALLGVADLSEAALSGGGGSGSGSGGGEGGEKEKGNDDGQQENEKDEKLSSPSLSSTLFTATTAAAKRVLSTISELDDCLAWAPAETAVRAPTRDRPLLFYLPSLRAALGLNVSEKTSKRPPVPIEEVTSLSLALRAATSTLTTVGAVRAQRLPRSVREAVSSVAGGGGGKGNEGDKGDELQKASSTSASLSSTSSNSRDTFELISPTAIAAWEALADAWKDREKLRRRRKRAEGEGGGEGNVSSTSFSGAEADAAVAALTAAAASAGERARARAAALRSLALKETAAGPAGSYRGMFERILPVSISSTLASTSTSTSSTWTSTSSTSTSSFRLAARARARFLAEVALVSKVARDAERALACLRAAVEAL